MNGLKLKTAFYSKDIKKKKKDIISEYEKLNKFFDDFLLTLECQELIKLFDEKIDTKEFKITPLKKIDFIIWQTR
jgi:hypothetical protein